MLMKDFKNIYNLNPPRDEIEYDMYEFEEEIIDYDYDDMVDNANKFLRLEEEELESLLKHEPQEEDLE